MSTTRYGNYVTDPERFAPGSSLYLPRAFAAHLKGNSTKRDDGTFVAMATYQGNSFPVAFKIDPDSGVVTEIPN